MHRTPRHRTHVVAAICWSTGGFLVRQLSIAGAWEIVFWRNLFMTLFVAGVLLVIREPAVARLGPSPPP